MGCDWLDVEAMARGRPTCVATYEPYIKNIDERPLRHEPVGRGVAARGSAPVLVRARNRNLP